MKKLALLLCLILVSCAVGPGEAIGKSREDIEITVYPAADYKVVLSTKNAVVGSANTGADGIVKFNILPLGSPYRIVVYDSKGVKLYDGSFTPYYVAGSEPYRFSIGKKVEVPAQVCKPNQISCSVDAQKILSCSFDGTLIKEIKCLAPTPWCVVEPTYTKCVECRFDSDCSAGKYCASGHVCSPIPGCTDSDGRNYFVKGTFSGIWNGQQITNTDSCVESLDETGDDVPSSNYLGEGYCENNQLKVERITCQSGCKDGACVSPVCKDSDNGLAVEVKGTTAVNGQQMTDFCNKGGVVAECRGEDCYLNEHYCYSSSQIGQKSDLICPYGCKDGACITQQEFIKTCFDSDARNYDKAGYVEAYETYNNGADTKDKHYDYCGVAGEETGKLVEYVCGSDGLVNKDIHSCPYGCKDGACLPAPNVDAVSLFACRRTRNKGGAYDHYVSTSYPCPAAPGGSDFITQRYLGRLLKYIAPEEGGVKLVYCYNYLGDEHLIAKGGCPAGSDYRQDLGYAYSYPKTGTIPLNRCFYSGGKGYDDNYVSLSNCNLGGVDEKIQETFYILPGCNDPDSKNIDMFGKTTSFYDNTVFTDRCEGISVIEYVCNSAILPYGVESRKYECKVGCRDGACVTDQQSPGIGGQAVLQTESSGSSGVLVVFIAAFGILVVTLLNFLHKEE